MESNRIPEACDFNHERRLHLQNFIRVYYVILRREETIIETEKKICEICGAEMAREEGLHEFMWGIYRYHGEAVSYRCPRCGYEKLGTCMVQFWEDDLPDASGNLEKEKSDVSATLSEELEEVKERELEKIPVDNKQSFFARVASQVKKKFQSTVEEQKEKEVEEEPLQPDKSDEPEQEKEVPAANLDTNPEELQEFRPKQESEEKELDNSDKNHRKVTLQKESDQKIKSKEGAVAKEDSKENMEKPGKNTLTGKTEPEQPQESSVTEYKDQKKHGETYRNDNGKQEIPKEETTASEKEKSVQDTLDQTDTKDESGQKEEAEERHTQEPEKVPKMFAEVKGKPALSDEWIAYMFEHHPKHFTAWFNRFASKQQKERYYLNTHVPKISVIMNDILYDTEKAEQYLTEEKDIRDGKMKVSYYRMPAGYFFKVLSIMGRSDELVTMEKKDVKKLLGKRPDIYRKIIPDEIKE